MHTNVKTALGIFLFFFFGLNALWNISESYYHRLKTLGDSMPVFSFLNPELFALVFVPLVVATAWRAWSGASHWSSVWFHSGVPLGLIASSISLIGVVQNVSTIEQYRSLVGESLLAVFYGGVISFIGYSSLNTTYRPKKRDGRSNKTKFFVCLLNAVLIGAGMDYYSGLGAFWDATTICIFLAIASGFLLGNRDESKSFCQLACEAMVMISLASVIIALVPYNTYQGYPKLTGSAVAIGILGPLYGSFVIFQCATFFPESDLREINFVKISWHLLEICGLWILMVFAPMSLLEMGAG